MPDPEDPEVEPGGDSEGPRETKFNRRHLAQLRSALSAAPTPATPASAGTPESAAVPENGDTRESAASSAPADAEAPGAPAETPAPLQLLLRAAVRPSGSQLLVGLLVGLLMFAAVTQVRLYSAGNAYSGLRQSDLVQALNGLQAASTRADAEIAQLTRTRDRLRSSSDRRATALQQATSELNTLGILAGTLPAVGPGIRIVVTDKNGQYRVNHLLDGVEELRDAGAEAIEINGKVRVVAQTSFTDAEGGISVDGQLLTSPYTLDVIGDPDTLSRALDFPGGFKDDVTLDQGKTKVTKVARVHIDATRQPTSPTYAVPQTSTSSTTP